MCITRNSKLYIDMDTCTESARSRYVAAPVAAAVREAGYSFLDVLTMLGDSWLVLAEDRDEGADYVLAVEGDKVRKLCKAAECYNCPVYGTPVPDAKLLICKKKAHIITMDGCAEPPKARNLYKVAEYDMLNGIVYATDIMVGRLPRLILDLDNPFDIVFPGFYAGTVMTARWSAVVL
jgi:hypothetical protein